MITSMKGKHRSIFYHLTGGETGQEGGGERKEHHKFLCQLNGIQTGRVGAAT